MNHDSKMALPGNVALGGKEIVGKYNLGEGQTVPALHSKLPFSVLVKVSPSVGDGVDVLLEGASMPVFVPQGSEATFYTSGPVVLSGKGNPATGVFAIYL